MKMNSNINKFLFYSGFLVYNISLYAYRLALFIASPFNLRAKKMLEARLNLWQNIEQKLSTLHDNTIWFHVSSLGEYEQARPVMEAIKLNHLEYKIVCTFFSPSGYDILKNDKASDCIFYLPFDSHLNAKRLIKIINPKMAFWVKYDLWHFYLQELHDKKIPIYLLSASFRNSQPYFKWYGVFLKSVLQKLTLIFSQNNETKLLLNSIGIGSIVTKDTRFDRVYRNVQQLHEMPAISAFKGNSLLLVAGSSYHIEEKILADFFAANTHNCKLIIAPHFVDEKRITEIESTFHNQCIRWSEYELIGEDQDKKILIIDCIGILSKIYRYADFAFIGGGFKHGGLHNILEAACFGVPTLFGPEINKFPEAEALIKVGGSKLVRDSNDFSDQLQSWIKNADERKQVGKQAANFISDNLGATELVMKHVFAK
jgi:3-deoxy-D-manno-octulosonic-acid transferase